MPRQNFATQFQEDLESHLAQILHDNPGVTHIEAAKLAQNVMLSNNPLVPPLRCLINDLPNELLAHIFQLGLVMEEEDQDEEESDDEAEEGTASDMSVDDQEIVDADEEQDAADGWEDETDSDESEIVRTKKSIIRHALKGSDDMDADSDDSDSDSDAGSDSDADSSDAELWSPFPVLVSHVCRQWREVAIETPTLWTNISFGAEVPLDAIKVYLQRSKGHPIHVAIDAQRTDEPDIDEVATDEYMEMNRSLELRTREDLNELYPDSGEIYLSSLSLKEVSDFLDIVLAHVERWKSFEAFVTFYSYMFLILERLSKARGAPLLESFQLYSYAYPEDDEHFEHFQPAELRTAFTMFGRAPLPCLQTTALWGVHLDWENSDSLLHGLKELELAYHCLDVLPSYAVFKRMMESSPALETLTLMNSGPGEPDDWPTGESDLISAPSIRNLVLCHLSASYLSTFFDHMSLPGVRHIAFDLANEDYSSFVRHLALAAPGRSQSFLSQLESIKLSHLPADDASSKKMLEQLVHLQHLNINCDEGEDSPVFLQLMDPQTTNPSSETTSPKLYCPQLRHLTVAGVASPQLKAFVTARMEAGLPLKKVSMSEFDDLEETDEQWLKSNLDELDFFVPSEYEEDDEDEDPLDITIDDML
ncbi:hypothetical protein DL96DRAFT_1612707 [Flagelloscypha sp. PMI_526]|nr:hypothetical protein DL96DRAFT_1612707 [Flagelloscypha sp. PMI_526]